MKTERFKQLAIVKEDSAPLVEKKLNAKLKELGDKVISIKFAEHDALCAYVEYEERQSVVETIEDEVSLRGCLFVCGDCPHFEPKRNRDGSVDARAKRGGCPFSKYGQTFCTSHACEVLYRQIENGEVRLCLAD